MPSITQTVKSIVEAPDWNKRVAQIRLIPQRHGTGEHIPIYAEVARELYVPNLVPDFAYIHEEAFYGEAHFLGAYKLASRLTKKFSRVSEAELTAVLKETPMTLLAFRTLLGLGKDEFAHSTTLVAGKDDPVISASKVDSMERTGTATSLKQATVIARTIIKIMDGTLFGAPPPGLILKQNKADTRRGWDSVRIFASKGVDLGIYLHQRHFGGAFRQVLDATSTKRGDIIEDAVEEIFKANRIPYLRTGSNNQADIAREFEVQITPAPDFVVFDDSRTLKGMLECKGTNNGGTARDKALRFGKLRTESVRLNGVPLLAVLGGIGWARVNDALAPVLRDTDGRVFTLKTLPDMLKVAPFPSLIGKAPA